MFLLLSQVTYNYHYFDDSLEGVRGMKRQPCMCGSAHCCGTIGGRVTQPGTTAVSSPFSTLSVVVTNANSCCTLCFVFVNRIRP